MNRHLFIITLSILSLIAPVATKAETPDTSTRTERNHIVEGNRLFREDRFGEAEVAFRKALEANAASQTANYNLAATLLRQGGDATLKEASQILTQVAQTATDISLAEKAFYNLGNLAFNSQDYAQAINHYKDALRRIPTDDKARQNLRLAQKRLQQQQQDDNKQQQQDQNQDQNQDQQQQQQQQQQQNQDNPDQNKDQNQDQQQPSQNQPQQQPQQQQGQISHENAQKILKAMENEEQATRARIQGQQQQKKGAPSHRQPVNPW